MAKKSKIAKNEQRKVIAARYVEKRRALKAVIASPHSSAQDKADAVVALQRMPRDASAARIRNRDAADGRPRGYLRKFALSRVRMRQMAHNGELPGVSKSSW
ncbi:30S ribosomal protein S14 [Amycolatopsis sp. NPDC023774]|uniref:30S ribosomal protein S14 n=1 Tax=Amycolatopsis sp. NPDC023774 TaxID=3155015 RepID=UPI0033F93D00